MSTKQQPAKLFRNADTTKIEIKPQQKMDTPTKIIIESKRSFETSLIAKDEIFRLLSLGETLRMPILLIGPPGTAKTKIVTDYTKGMFDLKNIDHVKHFNSDGVFILETDEGTKSSEVKGMVDMEKLVIDNRYEVNSPITRADTIVINEVDKASSTLRNSLLGIMNERVLFNGKNKIKCKWKLFVATCNEIPQDEMGSPFWDRFPIKINVARLSSSDMKKYWKQGDKKYSQIINVNIPAMTEIEKIKIPIGKLTTFLDLTYKECSDRTLSFVPLTAKAVSLVYGISTDKALIKTAELFTNPSIAEKLSKLIISVQKRAILDRIDMIISMTNNDQIESAIKEVEDLVGQYHAEGTINNNDIEEIKVLVETAMQDHPFYEVSSIAEAMDESDEILVSGNQDANIDAALTSDHF